MPDLRNGESIQQVVRTLKAPPNVVLETDELRKAEPPQDDYLVRRDVRSKLQTSRTRAESLIRAPLVFDKSRLKEIITHANMLGRQVERGSENARFFKHLPYTQFLAGKKVYASTITLESLTENIQILQRHENQMAQRDFQGIEQTQMLQTLEEHLIQLSKQITDDRLPKEFDVARSAVEFVWFQEEIYSQVFDDERQKLQDHIKRMLEKMMQTVEILQKDSIQMDPSSYKQQLEQILDSLMMSYKLDELKQGDEQCLEIWRAFMTEVRRVSLVYQQKQQELKIKTQIIDSSFEKINAIVLQIQQFPYRQETWLITMRYADFLRQKRPKKIQEASADDFIKAARLHIQMIEREIQKALLREVQSYTPLELFIDVEKKLIQTMEKVKKADLLLPRVLKLREKVMITVINQPELEKALLIDKKVASSQTINFLDDAKAKAVRYKQESDVDMSPLMEEYSVFIQKTIDEFSEAPSFNKLKQKVAQFRAVAGEIYERMEAFKTSVLARRKEIEALREFVSQMLPSMEELVQESCRAEIPEGCPWLQKLSYREQLYVVRCFCDTQAQNMTDNDLFASQLNEEALRALQGYCQGKRLPISYECLIQLEQKIQKILSKTKDADVLPDMHALRARAQIVIYSQTDYDYYLRSAQNALLKSAKDALFQLQEKQALLQEDLIDISELAQPFVADMRFYIQDAVKLRFFQAVKEEHSVVLHKIQEFWNNVAAVERKPFDKQKYIADQTKRIDQFAHNLLVIPTMLSQEPYFKKTTYLELLQRAGLQKTKNPTEKKYEDVMLVLDKIKEQCQTFFIPTDHLAILERIERVLSLMTARLSGVMQKSQVINYCDQMRAQIKVPDFDPQKFTAYIDGLKISLKNLIDNHIEWIKDQVNILFAHGISYKTQYQIGMLKELQTQIPDCTLKADIDRLRQRIDEEFADTQGDIATYFRGIREAQLRRIQQLTM